MDDDLHFNTAGPTGRAGATDDGASTANVTYEQLAEATGYRVDFLRDELEDWRVAELVEQHFGGQADDADGGGDGGDGDGDVTVPLDALDEETRSSLVRDLADALEMGMDVSGLLADLSDIGLDLDELREEVADRIAGYDDATAAAANAGVATNSALFAASHSLPPEWPPLADLDAPVPDELVGATLSDEAIAAVVNKLAEDVDGTDPGTRRVTAASVNDARDRSSGTSNRETGVSLEAFEAEDRATTRSTVDPDAELADMVGLDPRDEDVTMDARQAVKAVERAQSRRGEASTERTGTGLDDLPPADDGGA